MGDHAGDWKRNEIRKIFPDYDRHYVNRDVLSKVQDKLDAAYQIAGEAIGSRFLNEGVVKELADWMKSLNSALIIERARVENIERLRSMTHKLLLHLVDALDDPKIEKPTSVIAAVRNAKEFLRDPESSMRSLETQNEIQKCGILGFLGVK